jgi:hypothetical protein
LRKRRLRTPRRRLLLHIAPIQAARFLLEEEETKATTLE